MVCLTCHEKGKQANWTGGVHDRRGPGLHLLPRRPRLQVGAGPAQDGHATPRPATPATRPYAPRACGPRTTRPRGPHDVRELPQPARLHDAEDDQGGVRRTSSASSATPRSAGPSSGSTRRCARTASTATIPHGSNHDKLLVAKPPYLCQRCHLNTRHPGTLYDGQNTVAGAASPATARSSTPAGTVTRTSTAPTLRRGPIWGGSHEARISLLFILARASAPRRAPERRDSAKGFSLGEIDFGVRSGRSDTTPRSSRSTATCRRLLLPYLRLSTMDGAATTSSPRTCREMAATAWCGSSRCACGRLQLIPHRFGNDGRSSWTRPPTTSS